jgi:signal transduction histidine kinase
MLQRNDVSPGAPSPDALLVRANKLDLLERLADDLAHEIKNPLHSMVINLEVLKRRIARSGAEEQGDLQRYVGVLGTELERVSRRIELLLRLARPARGSEGATLDELVDELLELIQLEGRRQEVEVRFHPGAPTARVNVSGEPVRQVILDLALEALEHRGRGGVLLLRTEQGDGRASLVLSGTGEEAVPPPGDPGERLSVARILAERIGGTLEISPERVVFSLPPGNV